MLRRGQWRWFGLAVVVHTIFLGAVAQANGWSLEPLVAIHDGSYYVSHLADPFLQNVPEWWDNVPYRAIRFGYVLVALPFKGFGAVPALVVANLLGVGVGALAAREIARRHGASQNAAWFIWVINPGALVATALILPDTIAWAAILLALLAMGAKRWGWAAGLTLFAVLTKEASLVALGLASLVALRNGERRALVPVGVAAAGHLGLLAILVWQFGGPAHAGFFSPPLLGWLGAVPEWLSFRPLSGIVGLFVLTSGVLVIVRWWKLRSLYLAAAAGQAILMLFLSTTVVAPLAASARIGGLFWPLLAATKGRPEESDSHAMAGVAPTLKGDVPAAQNL